MRTLLSLLLVTSIVMAAPVPSSRPISKCPREFVGCYYHVNNTGATANFYADGYYDCKWGNQFWWGSWKFDRESCRIDVRETFSFDRSPTGWTFYVHRDNGRYRISDWVKLNRLP